MAVIYVSEPGAEVGLRNERIVVRKGKVRLASERVDNLERLVLAGFVQVSAQAIRALLEQDVDVVWQNQGGRHLGRLVAQGGRNAELIRQQFERLGDLAVALPLARAFVRGKLENQRRLLMRQRNFERSPAYVAALVQLRALIERLDGAATLDVVRGLEGAGAAAYFRAFGETLKVEGITFPGRVRRPPTDPTNILLSFGYTLLGHALTGIIETSGLFPYLGVLHEARTGRASLALDLIEEFRPVIVDATVIRVLNRREVRATDFIRVRDDAGSVEDAWAREYRNEDETPGRAERVLELSRDGAKRWFVSMERRLSEGVYYAPQDRTLTYRQVLQAQVWRLARHIRGEDTYEPFVVP
ncbi:MAG: CRISPR-associated endonuclease Cas1 [Bradymonadia bacterium]